MCIRDRLIIDLPKDGDTMLEETVINEASRPKSKDTEKRCV